MIDRKAFRKDFEVMQAALARRGEAVVAEDSAWGRARTLDISQRDVKVQSEALQAERNSVSKLIGQKKKQGEDASEELARMGEVAKQSKLLDVQAKEAEAAFSDALLEIPNLPHESVPDGADEND
ncbi:MAG: serine--tRNA ligase, partial [Ghiorsea sp.]|nr:serine--tRNA ligase [Ghiorsea sp.]